VEQIRRTQARHLQHSATDAAAASTSQLDKHNSPELENTALKGRCSSGDVPQMTRRVNPATTTQFGQHRFPPGL
jgi:hypothetical protein